MENKSSLFGIIAIIIGASGLGVGVFSVVNYQTIEGPQGPPGPLDFLVGVWEDLFRNMDYSPHNDVANWLIEVNNTVVNNSKYFCLDRSNTRFYLTKSGWYSFNLLMLLDFDASGTAVYRIYKNGVDIGLHPDWHSYSPAPEYVHINTLCYISSNGTDYYEFGFTSVACNVYTANQRYNQFAIEYLGEY
jgi:hypothetical protein